MAKNNKVKDTSAIAEAPQQDVAPQALPEEPPPQRLRINRYWLMWGVGIGLIPLGVLVASYWWSHPPTEIMTNIVGLLAIVILGAGVFIIRRQIKNRHDGRTSAAVVVRQINTPQSTQPVQDGEQPATQVLHNGHIPNSLNIYADKDSTFDIVMPSGIVFEYVENPLGQPMRCRNNNKDYHVHIWDIGGRRLVPFILPDKKYTDPGILARYLGLPAQRRYLRHRESLMKYIGPGLLVVANVAALITIIAMGG